MSDTMKATLKKIESMIADVVGAEPQETVQPMTAPEFVAYAQDQVTKAMGESVEMGHRRLKALAKSVRVAKDNFTDTENESINVPIYVCEQTSLDEKETQLMTPSKSAGMNPDGESVFESGFVAKLQRDLEIALKAMGGDEEEEEEEEEEPEEKKKAAEAKAEDVEEDDDAMKGKKAKAEKRLAKADRSADGTEWPLDLNDRDYVEKGVATKELEFGRD